MSTSSGTSLFGEKRTVLIVDLGARQPAGRMTPLYEAPLMSSLNSQLLIPLCNLILAMGSDLVTWYVGNEREAILQAASRQIVRATIILVVEGGLETKEETAKVVAQLNTLRASHPTDRQRLVSPHIAAIIRGEQRVVLGAERVFTWNAWGSSNEISKTESELFSEGRIQDGASPNASLYPLGVDREASPKRPVLREYRRGSLRDEVQRREEILAAVREEMSASPAASTSRAMEGKAAAAEAMAAVAREGSIEDSQFVVQQILEYLQEGVSLRGANARQFVRDLEELRLHRDALAEPSWIAQIVDSCYEHVPSEEENFPQLDETSKARLKKAIDEWDFYSPSFSRTELLHIALIIIERFNLIEVLELEEERLCTFLLAIERNYQQNPYHNFFHAIDVLQCCYYVLNSSLMLRRMFRPIDLLALLVAAISHDLGHPSFNNSFLVEHESLISWLYNDRSVLENMHTAILFAILRNPRYNFVPNWSVSQWKEFRTVICGAILGTDMAQHFDYIRQFQGIDGVFSHALKCLNIGEGNLTLSDRRNMSIAIIKFADICNVVRPFEGARRWGFHLVCEFFHQGDWEKALGYPSTPMTTRSLTDLAKGQQYFLNNVAGPLYRCMSEQFSELRFAEEQLHINLEHWRNWRPDTDDLISGYFELYPPDISRRSS